MNKVIVIMGPTGIGKTKLSIALAKELNGEIINADSTQVYRGLDIATAKVTKDEQDNIVHHLIDIRNVNEDYMVYDYQIDARICINDIIKRGKTPILVGGTGLYIKAVLYDYKFDMNNETNEFNDLNDEELYNELLKVDPNTEIHKNNRKRVARALTYYNINKEPFSGKEKTDTLLYDAIIIGLTTDRNKLYEIINSRVDIMIGNGLLEEAKKIYDSSIRSKAIMTPIGYKELFPYFDGIDSIDNCIDKIKQNSRKYAKRQYTWNHHQMNINWFNVNFDEFDETVREVNEFIVETSAIEKF